jgi:hypothetical protein
MAILVAAVVAVTVVLTVQMAAAPEPSATVLSLTSLGLGLAFILWVTADARIRRRTPCYDFGFLVGVFFPASLVWYVLWSRGRRGLLTLAALIGLMLLPYASAIVAWSLAHGPR